MRLAELPRSAGYYSNYPMISHLDALGTDHLLIAAVHCQSWLRSVLVRSKTNGWSSGVQYSNWYSN